MSEIEQLRREFNTYKQQVEEWSNRAADAFQKLEKRIQTLEMDNAKLRAKVGIR